MVNHKDVSKDLVSHSTLLSTIFPGAADNFMEPEHKKTQGAGVWIKISIYAEWILITGR